MRRLLLLIALSYVALSLSACGSLTSNTPQSGEEAAQEKSAGDAADGTADGGKSPRDKLDVCSLTTREEVEAALGRTVMEPTRADALVSRKAGTVTTSCMFGSNEGFVRLNVRRQDPGSAITWNAPRAYNDLKELVKGSDGQSSGRSEEVNGLGAAAFAETKAETTNYETTELRVLGERAILTIRVTGPASTPTLEAAKTIAGKATPRLERYESNTVAPAPDRPATSPQPAARLDGDERPKASAGAQAERKSAKETEQKTASRTTKETSTKAGQDKSRRDDSTSAKQSRKSLKESARKTAERTKKEAPKTARANPRSKRRP